MHAALHATAARRITVVLKGSEEALLARATSGSCWHHRLGGSSIQDWHGNVVPLPCPELPLVFCINYHLPENFLHRTEKCMLQYC